MRGKGEMEEIVEEMNGRGDLVEGGTEVKRKQKE